MEIHQSPQLKGDAAAQEVRIEVQRIKTRQTAQLRRDSTAQEVPRKIQVFELGKTSQFRRYVAGQRIDNEAVMRNTAALDTVGTNTVRRFVSACFGTASTMTRPPLTTGAIPTTSSHHPAMSGSCANATPTSSRGCSIS